MKQGNKNGGWTKSLALVLSKNNQAKVNGQHASAATRDKRSDVLFSGFRKLRELGYKLEDVRGFGGRHMDALVKSWVSSGYSASTMQNNISIFRVFTNWIGKDGLVRPSKTYVQDVRQVTRSLATETDKSWSGQRVDFKQKRNEVSKICPRCAIQLELQRAFGLRAKESWLLRPHGADKGSYLSVSHGTKGGRDRVIAITNSYQREVLQRAKALSDKNGSTSDPAKSLSQWKNHYYHVMRKAGITRTNGVTSHGLRHERLQEVYKEHTGTSAPVRTEGRRDHVPAEDDKAARQEVAEVAGHSRDSIAAAYIGK